MEKQTVDKELLQDVENLNAYVQKKMDEQTIAVLEKLLKGDFIRGRYTDNSLKWWSDEYNRSFDCNELLTKFKEENGNS